MTPDAGAKMRPSFMQVIVGDDMTVVRCKRVLPPGSFADANPPRADVVDLVRDDLATLTAFAKFQRVSAEVRRRRIPQYGSRFAPSSKTSPVRRLPPANPDNRFPAAVQSVCAKSVRAQRRARTGWPACEIAFRFNNA